MTVNDVVRPRRFRIVLTIAFKHTLSMSARIKSLDKMASRSHGGPHIDESIGVPIGLSPSISRCGSLAIGRVGG